MGKWRKVRLLLSRRKTLPVLVSVLIVKSQDCASFQLSQIKKCFDFWHVRNIKAIIPFLKDPAANSFFSGNFRSLLS